MTLIWKNINNQTNHAEISKVQIVKKLFSDARFRNAFLIHFIEKNHEMPQEHYQAQNQ